MDREELRDKIKNYLIMNYHEAEAVMDDLDSIRELIKIIRDSDSDITCNPSDYLVKEILNYICK